MNWLNRIPRYAWLIAAPVLLALGVYVMMLGNRATNPLVIFLGVIPAGVGILFIRQWFTGRVIQTTIVRHPGGNGEVKKDLPPPNCMNIYEDRVVFEYDAEPVGMMQKCYNDGQFYYVQKIQGDEKTALILPDDEMDQHYYDPAEFANVITMPCNLKYYTWAATRMQKIYVGVMALIGAGLIVGLIATT